MELSSWSLRQCGYRHRIPGTAPSHALTSVHTPIVVIRESGLTITELELELEASAILWVCVAQTTTFYEHAENNLNMPMYK